MPPRAFLTGTRALAATLGAAFLLCAAGAGSAAADDPSINPMDPVIHRGDQYVPKPPGTREELTLYYGPYLVPAGADANRFDLNLPLRSGFVVSIEPGMRFAADGTEPSHQTAHIHHSHWLALRDGSNEMDAYTGGFTQWMFGNGDEETRADSEPRSAAQPHGPIYGGFIGPTDPGPMIYMLHNKTSKPLVVYIVLEITYIHGTMEQLNSLGGRPYHNLIGTIFGDTFDVPRDPRSRDATYETAEDAAERIEWTSPIDGTIIGMGGHLHPGGLRAVIENYGSEERPCADSDGGYGGTVLLKSDALWRHGVPYSEDFQIEVTHPAWRAPIHEGDRLQISGTYENRRHGWYDVMTHAGMYVDEAQPPRGRCTPYLVGPAAKRDIRVTAGVPNRRWGHHETDTVCGRRFGADSCSRPQKPYRPGISTDEVTIANFLYQPGDQSLDGKLGAPVQVREGSSLRFVNLDQALGIRHSVTTCRWPCNGPYVANYPLPDGVWDSGTLGYDIVDGGSPNPISNTPTNLRAGKYSYFCRIHPWMRGAFEVVEG